MRPSTDPDGTYDEKILFGDDDAGEDEDHAADPVDGLVDRFSYEISGCDNSLSDVSALDESREQMWELMSSDAFDSLKHHHDGALTKPPPGDDEAYWKGMARMYVSPEQGDWAIYDVVKAHCERNKRLSEVGGDLFEKAWGNDKFWDELGGVSCSQTGTFPAASLPSSSDREYRAGERTLSPEELLGFD